MTMADTIAVMNLGRIEQMGGPSELYESPRTVFVANFLGQSNLLDAAVTGTSGDDLLLDVRGSRLAMPSRRRSSGDRELLVGVRPEKIRLAPAGEGASAGGGRENVLPGGVVADASFFGVSTQYIVRMPWGQDITVFVQNLGTTGPMPVGTTVDLHWDAGHTFGLDASEPTPAAPGRDEGAPAVPVG